MCDVDINTLSIEEYLALTRGNKPGVVIPEIGNDVDFEIISQFLRELRRILFASVDDEDAHEYVRSVLEIADLFHILGVTHDAVMLRVFPITLTGAARRWKNKLLARPITCALKSILDMADHSQNWYNRATTWQRSNHNSNDITVITNRLDSLGCDRKKRKESIHAMQEGCKSPQWVHLTQEFPFRKEDEAVEQVKYIGFLEETINKYCEELIKAQAAHDEWINKLRENTNLNLKKLDGITKNLEVKVKRLTQTVMTNEENKVEKVKAKMEKVKEVMKEPETREEELQLLIVKDIQSSLIEMEELSSVMKRMLNLRPSFGCYDDRGRKIDITLDLG
uniref:Lon protease 2, peroxisomal n=1 Tax=Tanacetum cinerariifolium TaxID=118510 RepID=A0A6L2JLW5_TANCI|nr:lon protease 2, peroxisomal [Tanacetum cinerariifolium]